MTADVATTGFDSLVETLLRRRGSGIAARFAPTRLSSEVQAHQLNKTIVDGLYANGRSGILEDATKAPLANLKASDGSGQMLDVYQILGDTALKVPR